MKNRNKLFTSIAVLGSAIFAMVLTAGNGFFETLGIFNKGTTGSTNYNVVLDKNNAYSDGNTKVISTSFGKNPIIFDYSDGCSSFTNSHVRLAADATIGNYYKANSSSSGVEWNNKLSSIESIKPVFNADTGASLQFRASYDGKTPGTWGDFAPLTSNTAFTLTSKPYYIELKAVGGSITLTSCEICYSCIENPDAKGTPKYEVGLSVNNGEKLYYSQNDIFDNLIDASNKNKNRAITISTSFDVSAILSDKSSKTLKKGEFSYFVTKGNTNIDTSKPFESTGTHTAHIKYSNLPEILADFEVSAILIEEISIPNELNLNTGSSQTITASIVPSNATNKNLSWTSSDPTVAEIDSTGKITAKKAGNTTVKATALDGSGIYSGNCLVKVSDIAVSSVSFDKHSITLKTNETDTITATVLPIDASDKSLTWISDDESIATVVNGVVTAHEEGETTITAKANNNVQDVCTVTVSNAVPVDERLQTAYEDAIKLSSGSTSTGYYEYSGVVIGTRTSGNSSDVYVQSGDYALDVFNSGYSPVLKDKISVKSKVKNYNGLPESDAVLNFAIDEHNCTLPISKSINSASDLSSAKINSLLNVSGKISSLSSTGDNISLSNDLTIQLTLSDGNSAQVFIKKNSYSAKLNFLKSLRVDDNLTIQNGIRGIYKNRTSIINQILVVNESVLSSEIIPVEGVSISDSSVDVYAGNTIQLSASILPGNATNQQVTWTSDDPSVASVDQSGLVSGNIAGSSTTIRVTTEEGGFEASCVVNVKTAPIVLKSLTVSEEHRTFTTGDSFIKETVTANYSNGTYRDVTNDAVFSSPNMNIAGNKTINVSYTENDVTKTISYMIVVSDPVVLNSISVSGQTSKFSIGDDFIFGGTVKAHYSDGSEKDVTSSATFSGYDLDTAGSQTVTVSYTEGITRTTTYSITVTSGDTPSGDEYQITFSSASADGSTDLTASTIFNQVSSGGSYIDSINSISKVYAGKHGLKFSSGNTSGHLSFNVSDDISTNETSAICLSSTAYSESESSTFSVYLNGSDSAAFTLSAGDSDNTYSFISPIKINSIEIESSKRAYLDGITFICKPVVPVDPTGILLNQSTSNIGIGENYTLIHSFKPAGVNRNNGVTWNSSNPGIATVSNGVVTGVSVGTTDITVTSTYNTNFTATCSVTVSKIGVISVTLNTNSETLTIGDTTQLTATVSPSSATNKNINWSTGNSSIATVSNTGLVTAKAVGNTTITATSADDSTKKATCDIEVTNVQKDAWTIMIYMCGSTLEYNPNDEDDPYWGFATSDLKQMLSVSLPDDVNVIIETGGVAGDWSLGSSYFDTSLPSTQRKISKTNLQRWEIKNKKLSLISTLSTNQMSKESEVDSFLEWGINNYPANNTGVIFWNHGGGIGGVCSDENYTYKSGRYTYANNLNCGEIARATETALDNTGLSKLTWIGYDACLMGVSDLASVNADYYKYMVASPESEPGSGWNYKDFLQTLVNKKSNTKENVESILDKICESFISENCSGADCGEYDSYYEEYYYCYSTLAVYDLSKAGNLIDAFNTYATNLNINSTSYKKIKTAYTKCYSYGEDSDGSLYGNGDFISFLDEMDKQFPSVSSANLRSAISNLVISNYYCPYYQTNKHINPCGICVFVAEALRSSGYGLQCSKDEDYNDSYATKFSVWQSILSDNAGW